MRRDPAQYHYKPALLLSLLDLQDDGLAVDVIPIEPLVIRFAEVLRHAGLKGADRAFMPAWHLACNSGTPVPFWEIEWRTALASNPQPGSTRALVGQASAVRLLPELVSELREATDRWVARQAVYELLERDARPNAIALLEAWPGDLAHARDAQVVMESRAAKAFKLDDDEPRTTSWTREAVLRDRGLRNIVLPQYAFHCALCSMRIRWNGVAEIEVAHVKPRALGGVDDPRNTIALCRTHHWAFDRFLWTISPDDWTVRVQKARHTRGDDVAVLLRHGRLEGLPDGIRYPPHRLALEWHAARFAAHEGS